MNIEHGTFTPLVFTINGGMGVECSMYHKQLAKKISEKGDEKYERVLTYIKTKLSFAILKSAALCLKGIENCQQILLRTLGIGFGDARMGWGR